MDVKYFLKKLGKNGVTILESDNALNLTIKIKINVTDLQDNLDLLAREMHMEVESMANSTKEQRSKRVKHEKIHVDGLRDILK